MATVVATEESPAPAIARSRRRKPLRIRAWSGVQAYAILLALLALLAVMFAPFLIILINAIKTPTDLAANGPLSIPTSPTLDNI